MLSNKLELLILYTNKKQDLFLEIMITKLKLINCYSFEDYMILIKEL